jgi:hypothetical protein
VTGIAVIYALLVVSYPVPLTGQVMAQVTAPVMVQATAPVTGQAMVQVTVQVTVRASVPSWDAVIDEADVDDGESDDAASGGDALLF